MGYPNPPMPVGGLFDSQKDLSNDFIFCQHGKNSIRIVSMWLLPFRIDS